MTLEPVLSSVLFRGQNLQGTGGVAGVVGFEGGEVQEGANQFIEVGQWAGVGLGQEPLAPLGVDQIYLHMTLMESSAACTLACSSAI